MQTTKAQAPSEESPKSLQSPKTVSGKFLLRGAVSLLIIGLVALVGYLWIQGARWKSVPSVADWLGVGGVVLLGFVSAVIVMIRGVLLGVMFLLTSSIVGTVAVSFLSNY